MAIRVQCGACGVVMNVKDEMGGQPGKCPKCGAVINVPVAEPPPLPTLEPDLSDSSGCHDSFGQPSQEIQAYCRNCGKQVHPQAFACPSCGVPPRLERKFCPNCGTATHPLQAMCTKCGASFDGGAAAGDKDKIAAGLLGIFLGGLGIHKFYLGYQSEGLTMLLVCLVGGIVTCGLASFVMHIIGLIEGIIYITKTNEEFAQLYVRGRKGWF